MIPFRVVIALVVLVFSSSSLCQNLSPELSANLQARIDLHYNPSIVVGILDPGGRRYYSFGTTELGATKAPDSETLYEIGSITKTFTATLLAQMATEGVVDLSDPLQTYLPKDIVLAPFEDRAITLEDLATHSSGLPRIPSNMNPDDPANPYADYSVEDLYSFLRSHTLQTKPGTQTAYSNLGMGLLGHALGRAANQGFETLINERLLQPLNMAATHFPDTQAASNARKFAPPYAQQNGELVPAANWQIPTLPGAGALRSNAHDMLNYLAAQLELGGAPLQATVRMTHTPRKSFGDDQIGLGWIIRGEGPEQFYWHNGGTGGYRAFAGFSKQKRLAVVVLTNSTVSVDDVGFHLLDSSHKLNEFKAIQQRQAIVLPTTALEKLTGRFELAPNFVIEVFLKDGKLFSQATNQQPIEMFAESPSKFFVKVVDAQLSFELDENGRAKSLTLHQNGQNIPGRKLD